MSSAEVAKSTFDGVPGHKRRESVAVASVKAPTMVPRLNKSAALRAQKPDAPPTSFMFRGASAPKLPGVSITNSQSSTSLTDPSQSSAPASQSPVKSPPLRHAAPRPSSVAACPFPSPKLTGGTGPKTADISSEAPTVRPRPSSVCARPSIAPRTNRSAALRLAKQEAENAAAAAAAARKMTRPKVAPSSFKPIAS